MLGERISHSHEPFFGREKLLAELDRLLVTEPGDRWVVVTGAPGVGKSALLAKWLQRRVATGAAVPHHFIRRGMYGSDEPARLVASLVAQLDKLFPDARVSSEDLGVHPVFRLTTCLWLVSERELDRPGRRRRLVVVLDGLDEYDPPANTASGDPLAAFLPQALPPGVSFLCSSRPRLPHVMALKLRYGDHVSIDLDTDEYAEDNEATVRAFWNGATEKSFLNPRFVDEAVRRARGNMQHAVQLRRQIAGQPPERHRASDIPEGLKALIDQIWRRIEHNPVAVTGLGVLCAAREALTLDEIADVARWTEPAQRRKFVEAAREVLVESPREDDPREDDPREYSSHDRREYRLHHDAVRVFVANEIGSVALRDHHRSIVANLATWPPPPQATKRRYALRHALAHRAQAGDWTDVWNVASDPDFLKARCLELGVHELEREIIRVEFLCRRAGYLAKADRLSGLARAIARESHWLRVAPGEIAAILWNRLRRADWSEQDLEVLRDGASSSLRVRSIATRASSAMIRDLRGHASEVTACAITSDGRVVSASRDRTIRVWDFASGREISCLTDYDDGLCACSLTPDGALVVAVSKNRGLLITNLRSRSVLDVQECYSGRASSVVPKQEPAVDFDDDAPTTPGQELSTDDPTGPTSRFPPPTQEPVRPGKDYEMLRLWEQHSTLADVEDRAGQVTACAVTPDGRCVVLGTDYGTLTVWDASNGLGLADLEESTDRITACAITPDGQRVIAGSDQGTVTVWDVDYRRPLCTLSGLASPVDACAVTADGKLGAAASSATLIVWDIERECAVQTVQLDGVVSACTMTNDGRCVITGADNGALTVWDIRNGELLATLDGHTDAILACAVTDDGQRLVSASRDRTLKVWELDAGRAHAPVAGHADAVTACVVTQDGLRVVSASADGTLKLWDATCGRELHTLNDHGAVVSACAVPSEGNLLVSASFDATVKVWDLTTMRVVKTLREHTDPVRACTITEDGTIVLSASDTQTLVWDLGEERITRFVDLNKSRSSYVVTLDPRRIVAGSHHGLTVRNVSNGAIIVKLEDVDVSSDDAWMITCTIMPDGARAVTGSSNGAVKIWDLATGTVLDTLEGHADAVMACAVSSDGRYIFSASHDCTLKIWDVSTGSCLVTHRGDVPYRAVAIAGRSVFAGDVLGGVWFLDWSQPDDPVAGEARPPGVARLDVSALLRKLVEQFSRVEIDQLCMELEDRLRNEGIEESLSSDILGGQGTRELATNLVHHLQRRNLLPHLVELVRAHRPGP